MNNIGGFFDKFKNLALLEMRKREKIIEAIWKSTGHKIEARDISIRDGVVNIKTSAMLKSEIFLKKTKILEYINQNLPELKIKDIK